MGKPSILILLFITAALAGPSSRMVTPVYPSSDGCIAKKKVFVKQKELRVRGDRGMMSWVCFDLRGYTFKRSRTCMLSLYISTVKGTGVCDIHPLTRMVTASPRRITRASVRYDDMPLVSVVLDSSYAGQMLFVNITELAKSGSFDGVVLQTRNGLSATFSSCEGALPPAILCTHDLESRASVSWFNGPGPPDPSTGKTGDFFIRTANGTVYYRAGESWDPVCCISIPVNKKNRRAATSRSTGMARR
ncbi:MAG: hypothetical protein JW768_16215 [Chitinispirillaceae bacterium]|nr:hypothetical protein [Chitinispirillaceae bacterium]